MARGNKPSRNARRIAQSEARQADNIAKIRGKITLGAYPNGGKR